MEARKRACDRCSSIKQVCSGEATCQRCSRLGLQCTFERQAKPLGRPRAGCSSRRSTSHGSPTNSSVTKGQRARNPRSRFGCLNCRLRRKKCDENWPECGDCTRLRLECSGPYQQPGSKRNGSNEVFHISSSCVSSGNSQIMANSQMSFDLGMENNEMDLLTTFVKNVSSVLFSAENSQVFLGFIVPLCLEDSSIKNSILGMTAAYMAGGNDCYIIDYMLYKAKAEMSLSNVEPVSDQSILLILLMTILEVLDGSSVNWSRYLRTTYQYISQRGGLRKFSKASPLTFFISQIFCYLDFMSSLSTCSVPLLESSSSTIDDGQDILTSSEVGATFRVGIAGEIVSILGRISSLASMRSARESEPEYEARFERLATQIEFQLQNWLPPLKLEYAVDDSTPQSTTRQNVPTSVALCIQWAAFMRLHQVRYGYNKSDVRTVVCLQHILAALKGIPMSSPLEGGLVFPLIMAGSAATELEDKEYILCRLHSLKNHLKFGYIEKIEKMLQTVWDRDCLSATNTNWASIRYYEFPGIVMF